jgi:hypothetical protein
VPDKTKSSDLALLKKRNEQQTFANSVAQMGSSSTFAAEVRVRSLSEVISTPSSARIRAAARSSFRTNYNTR